KTEWFPNKNIVAWGHNVHISSYIGAWHDSIGAFAHLKEMIGEDNVYSLLHSFDHGYITPMYAELELRSTPYYASSVPNSVEKLLAQNGVETAFIEMANLASLSSPNSIVGQSLLRATELADGLIYTQEETPSTIDSPR
ncbi:erythromycin esterase family protein, partial [Vibrio paucivorans]